MPGRTLDATGKVRMVSRQISLTDTNHAVSACNSVHTGSVPVLANVLYRHQGDAIDWPYRLR